MPGENAASHSGKNDSRLASGEGELSLAGKHPLQSLSSSLLARPTCVLYCLSSEDFSRRSNFSLSAVQSYEANTNPGDFILTSIY